MCTALYYNQGLPNIWGMIWLKIAQKAARKVAPYCIVASVYSFHCCCCLIKWSMWLWCKSVASVYNFLITKGHNLLPDARPIVPHRNKTGLSSGSNTANLIVVPKIIWLLQVWMKQVTKVANFLSDCKMGKLFKLICENAENFSHGPAEGFNTLHNLLISNLKS